ncbi:MAG: hypothetical protein ACRDJW_11135 [Thermomicrobiales bacterium]
MAAQNLRQREEVEEDDLAGVRAYLAERGVHPDGEGRFTKRHIPAIEQAIREREWIPTLKRDGGEWVVLVQNQHNLTSSPEEFWIDPDPIRALLYTLDVVRRWMTKSESDEYFDREARRMTGMSGEEFRLKWDADELDYDDPHVIDVGMLLPRGR